MDLGTLSPDVDARFCYLIVVLAGMLTAVRKVDERLANISGAWSALGTHRLFFFFWATPVVLFFLLDHSGAVNDTSPVAALVVAVTYGAILSGSAQPGLGQPAVPGQITNLWTQLLGDADKISADVQSRLQTKTFTYLRSATSEIAGDQQKFDRLYVLVRQLLTDSTELDDALKKHDDVKDPKVATWKKARELITTLSGVYVLRRLNDDAHVLLLKEGLIGWRTYLRFPGKQIGDVWRFFSVLLPAAIIVTLAILSFADYRNWDGDWLKWRLSKSNVTAVDLARTRESLIDRIQRSKSPDEEVRSLGHVIREGSMAPPRVDAAIGVMKDGIRERSDRDDLNNVLINTLVLSLRTPNVDGRTRVHSGLIYLARPQLDSNSNEAKRKEFDDLKDWKPSESDSVTDLASRIDQWRRFFGLPRGSTDSRQ